MHELWTKNGHNLYDVSSLLQKAIRRGDGAMAGYAVNELRGRYLEYLWKRLAIISAEDCWGVITKEVMALKEADDLYNKKLKGYDCCDVFLAKAVTLMIKAYKNRDADWFTCNLIQSEETLNITKYINLAELQKPILNLPEYTYDCHTKKGRMMGKTKDQMIRDEQKALKPLMKGDYDDADWSKWNEIEKKMNQDKFNQEKGFPMPSKSDVDSIGSNHQQSLF